MSAPAPTSAPAADSVAPRAAAGPPAGTGGRVLCVDDEPFVLDGLRRALHRRYDLVVTSSATEAIEWVTAAPDEFDVIMSDLKMPGMDGITLLSQLRDLAPASVRILLTGHGDLSSAMDAVNRGSIFRFLTKPASRAELIAALDAASEQHRLIVAERELLEQTLRGSVAALLETLSLANPAAFARTGRMRRVVALLADDLGIGGWELEVATMVSQIGAVTVAAETIAKIDAGEPLTVEERQAVEAVPEVSERLLAAIPRLDEVRRIVRYQTHRYDGQGHGPAGPVGDELPVGARILKLAHDLDVLESQGYERDVAVRELREHPGQVDPELVERLFALGRPEGAASVDVDVTELQAGMVVEADVHDTAGVLLLPRGREITEQLLGVVQGYVTRGRLAGRIAVTVPGGAGAGESDGGSGGVGAGD